MEMRIIFNKLVEMVQPIPNRPLPSLVKLEEQHIPSRGCSRLPSLCSIFRVKSHIQSLLQWRSIPSQVRRTAYPTWGCGCSTVPSLCYIFRVEPHIQSFLQCRCLKFEFSKSSSKNLKDGIDSAYL